MFLDENLLIDFLLTKTHDMTLSHQKNVYWICVLNLNLRLKLLNLTLRLKSQLDQSLTESIREL